jgi:cell division control protein 11
MRGGCPCPTHPHQAIDPVLTAVQTLKTRRKKNVKKGIQFCLMVCGASGTGRTTFVNTLCGKQVLEHKESDDPTAAHVEEGVKIQPITVGMSAQCLVISRAVC